MLSLLIQAFYVILIPLSMILLARIMGAEAFGVYSFAIAVVILLSVPANMGFPSVLIRFIAKYEYEKRVGLIPTIISYAQRYVSLISVALILILWIVTYQDWVSLTEQQRWVLRWASPLILLISLEEIRSSALKGLNKVLIGQLPQLIIRPLLLLAFILILFLYQGMLRAEEAVISYLISVFISWLIGSWWLHKSTSAIKKDSAFKEISLWWAASIPLLFSGSIQIIGRQTDMVFMGLMRTEAETGVYRAAFQYASLVTLGWLAINTVIAPRITQLYESKNKKELQKMVFSANYGTLAIAVPIAIMGWFFGSFILSFFFGETFETGYEALQILCLGHVVNAFFGSSTTVLKMTGFEKTALCGLLLGTVINVVLNALWIPEYGMKGAAWASTLSMVFWNTYLLWQVHKKLEINPLLWTS